MKGILFMNNKIDETYVQIKSISAYYTNKCMKFIEKYKHTFTLENKEKMSFDTENFFDTEDCIVAIINNKDNLIIKFKDNNTKVESCLYSLFFKIKTEKEKKFNLENEWNIFKDFKILKKIDFSHIDNRVSKIVLPCEISNKANFNYVKVWSNKLLIKPIIDDIEPKISTLKAIMEEYYENIRYETVSRNQRNNSTIKEDEEDYESLSPEEMVYEIEDSDIFGALEDLLDSFEYLRENCSYFQKNNK